VFQLNLRLGVAKFKNTMVNTRCFNLTIIRLLIEELRLCELNIVVSISNVGSVFRKLKNGQRVRLTGFSFITSSEFTVWFDHFHVLFIQRSFLQGISHGYVGWQW